MTATDRGSLISELADLETEASGRRRRLVVLAIGVVLAAAIAATWAAGVVTSTSTAGTITTAPPLLVNPAANPPSRFDDALLEHDTLAIGFSGGWGVIAADTGLFDLDLTGSQFAGGTFYVTVVVLNEPNGWERLQLQFHALEGACDAAPDYTSPISSGILYVETTDDRVNLTELSAGGRYCIGVRSTVKANDPATTYIRRPSSSVVPTMPVFAATVGQSS